MVLVDDVFQLPLRPNDFVNCVESIRGQKFLGILFPCSGIINPKQYNFVLPKNLADNALAVLPTQRLCIQGVMGGAELLNVADEQSAENCAPDRR
jgi:hypothetical protein